MRGALGFSVSRFWPFFWSVFRFWYMLITVCGFSIFKHLVFGFRPKYKRFIGSSIRCGFVFGFSYLVSGFSSAIMFLNRVRENKFDESSEKDVDISTDDNSSQGQLTCDQAFFYSRERASVAATREAAVFLSRPPTRALPHFRAPPKKRTPDRRLRANKMN